MIDRVIHVIVSYAQVGMVGFGIGSLIWAGVDVVTSANGTVAFAVSGAIAAVCAMVSSVAETLRKNAESRRNSELQELRRQIEAYHRPSPPPITPQPAAPEG